MRWAARYESKSDIIFRPRSVRVEIRDETTLTLSPKKERKRFSGQNVLDRWVLPPTTLSPTSAPGKLCLEVRGPGVAPVRSPHSPV